MNCPRCKSEITPQDKYCPSCGAATEAGKQAATRKPVKKAYEEASTQVLDVDEFKRYMAAEKPAASGGAAAAPIPEVADAAPVSPPAKAALSEAIPPPSPPTTGDLSPAELKSSGTYEPAPAGRNPMMMAIGALVVVIIALLLYRFVL